MNNHLLIETFQGHQVPIRQDGYWNLTAMCKLYEKNVADFLRLNSTQAFLKEFNYDVGNSPQGISASEQQSEPVMSSSDFNSHVGNVSWLKPLGVAINPLEVVKGGSPQQQGTWGRIELAIKLAAWLNPRFEVWVYRTIAKLMVEGQVKLNQELASLRQAFNEADRGWEETANQLALMEQKLDRVSYERDELSEIYSPVALKRNLGFSRGRSTPYSLGLRKKSKKFGSEF